MNIKMFLEQALNRGENIKAEIEKEIFKSKAVKELFKSDLFVKAVATVLKTKDEVSRVLAQNIKAILKIIDVPLQRDIGALQQKIDLLEKSVDQFTRRAITVKSLKKIHSQKLKTNFISPNKAATKKTITINPKQRQ